MKCVCGGECVKDAAKKFSASFAGFSQIEGGEDSSRNCEKSKYREMNCGSLFLEQERDKRFNKKGV